jgi:hypothetical protein
MIATASANKYFDTNTNTDKNIDKNDKADTRRMPLYVYIRTSVASVRMIALQSSA